MTCLNSNDQHLANTLKSTPWKWSPSIFICAMLMFLISSTVADGEFQYPLQIRNELVAKDGNTLLNPVLLPFLNDCSNPSNRMLCATYYDMVYNVYEYGGNVADVKAEIRTANQALENLGDEFCSIFPSEVTDALDKQPFLDANHINLTLLFSVKTYCTISCLTVQETNGKLVIKPICKSISGGCKWILNQKRNAGVKDIGLPAVDPGINQNESTKMEEKLPANESQKTKMLQNEPPKSIDQNTNKMNQESSVSLNVKIGDTVNESTNTNVNIEQTRKLNLSSVDPNPNPIPNEKPINDKNVTKPVDPVLPQQPIVSDDKTGIVSLAPKIIENRPSTPSVSKSSQIKDTNTEQHEDDGNGDDSLYKNELEDQDKQDDDAETGDAFNYEAIQMHQP